MSNYVVWIDTDHAQLFELHEDAATHKESLKRHEVRHHHRAEKEKLHHQHSDHFFHEVAGHLREANQILLIGPGNAKKLFQGHLRDHHHATLMNKVIGMETCDHPTDGQIVAFGKKFFKTHQIHG